MTLSPGQGDLALSGFTPTSGRAESAERLAQSDTTLTGTPPTTSSRTSPSSAAGAICKPTVAIRPPGKIYYADDNAGIYILHGDCQEILPTLAPVDLVLTDPPYASLDVATGSGTTTRLVRLDALGGKRLASSTTRSWFSTLSADQLGGIWPLVRRLLRDDGALYVMADVKSGLEFFPVLAPANVIVWDKGSIGMGYSWRRMHEWIAYCPCENHVLRDKGLGDIIRVSGESCKEHPTEKPKRLFHPIIRNSSDPDDIVLDPFMGSGTTLAAAKDLGRRAIGIEIEERYCEIAVNRLSQEVLGL